MRRFLMQARSTTSGSLVTWLVNTAPDYTGASFPGPGSPEYVASTEYVGLSTPGYANTIASALDITPALGSTLGSTHVVIRVNRSAGMISAKVGGANLTSFVIVDSTHVAGNTAAHAAGAVNVTVTNGAGESDPLVGAFTFGLVPATVLGVAPTFGPPAGGTHVVLHVADSTGITGASVGGAPLDGFSIVDATHVAGDTRAHAAGAVSATVSNAYGTSAPLANAFSYATLATVVSITPSTGAGAGGTHVVLQVSNVTGITSAEIDGVAIANFQIEVGAPPRVSGDTLAHADGAVDVTVTNAAGTSAPLVGGFTFASGGAWTFADTTTDAWWLADDATVVTGSRVSALVDRGSSGDANRGLSQPGSKPLYSASDAGYGSKPSITFAGEYLPKINTWSSAPAVPIAIIVVGQLDADVVAFLADNFGNKNMMWGIGALVKFYSGSANFAASAFTISTPTVFMFTDDGAASKMYVNNLTTPVTTDATGFAAGGTGFDLGVGIAGVGNLVGKLAEVVILDHIPDATEVGNIADYFNTVRAYGIAVTH